MNATNGLTLHALRWAPARVTRPPVLLVHGLASNALMWVGVGRHLAAAGHEVAAVDLRGHGRSDKPDAGYDFATMSDDLVAALDHLGWDRAIVAGQSLGGNVVIELAFRAPERVLAVLPVDGGMIELQDRFPDWNDCEREMKPPRLIGTAATRLEGVMRQSHSDWPEDGIAGTMGCFEIRDDGTISPWLTFERHIMALRALWEHRPSTRYPQITVPVVFIPADGHDVKWTLSKRASIDQALTVLPYGRAEWIAGDHDLHAQFPEQVAVVISNAVAE